MGEATIGASAAPVSTVDLMLIEQRITNNGKKVGIAYLLWFFLFIFSAHRFYLGRPITALLQIASYFVLVGFVWAIVDAFLIPGMVHKENDDMRGRLIQLRRASLLEA